MGVVEVIWGWILVGVVGGKASMSDLRFMGVGARF